MCERPRENPAGSCQCSIDAALSSHDAPYFETYLSSQAFFTFVTTLTSMGVCLSFLLPFPLNSAKLHTDESLYNKPLI